MKKEDKKSKNSSGRHQRIWNFLRFFGKLIYKSRYNYAYKNAPSNLESPYIVVSNHVTSSDEALVGLSFKKQMYFLADGRIYGKKDFHSKLIYWAFNPIARMYGKAGRITQLQILKTLHSGKNVCLFPEENRTFNGKTGDISDDVVKLIKTSGVNLVTYRIEGGYFSDPLWANGRRKGRMHGQIVNIYSKNQMKEMTEEQIKNLISADIHENAYDRQKMEHISFSGKKIAEGLESCVCVCPKCKRTDTIHAEDNSVFCENCGEYTELDSKGYFKDGFNFHTIEEWDSWQTDFIKKQTLKTLENAKSKGESERLYSIEDITLKLINSDCTENFLGTGSFALYTDKIDFHSSETDKSLETASVTEMWMSDKYSLYFTDSEGNWYQLKTDKNINLRKFIIALKTLN